MWLPGDYLGWRMAACFLLYIGDIAARQPGDLQQILFKSFTNRICEVFMFASPEVLTGLGQKGFEVHVRVPLLEAEDLEQPLLGQLPGAVLLAGFTASSSLRAAAWGGWSKAGDSPDHGRPGGDADLPGSSPGAPPASSAAVSAPRAGSGAGGGVSGSPPLGDGDSRAGHLEGSAVQCTWGASGLACLAHLCNMSRETKSLNSL
jgi:hypothetical protein